MGFALVRLTDICVLLVPPVLLCAPAQVVDSDAGVATALAQQLEVAVRDELVGGALQQKL